ncbi:hypothetical protein [Mesorhizobium sp. M0619]|uniref:hypothetical protein n=1 Tax=unclassified Mesorhizobium TaxID=325217 RepID=UPI00333BEB20
MPESTATNAASYTTPRDTILKYVGLPIGESLFACLVSESIDNAKKAKLSQLA